MTELGRAHVPWSDKVLAARLINEGVREMAGRKGWVVLEHPFAKGAGGGEETVPTALLAEDGLHFKLSLAWSWLNEGLRRAIEGQ